MKFQVGEICLLVPNLRTNDRDKYLNRYGNDEVEILVLHSVPPIEAAEKIWYTVQASDHMKFYVAESGLRKLPPPNELDSWDRCIWKPKEYAKPKDTVPNLIY